METFTAFDGTLLAYHRTGAGTPLICVPGGPMQASAYLEGVVAAPALRLDLRGTGDSAVPDDPATYRCDRQVDDLEALREHLGLGALDLLGHSGGGTLAVLYAARHPGRVGRLLLVTPSPRPVGIEVTGEDRRAIAETRKDEPWFPEAFAALERIRAGSPTDEDWAAADPFVYGRWDDTARAHAELGERRTNHEAAAAYYGTGAFDPAEVRAGLARVAAPVLVIGGEHDIQLPPSHAARYAGLFGDATVAIAPGAGHFPWLDEPSWFAVTLRGSRG